MPWLAVAGAIAAGVGALASGTTAVVGAATGAGKIDPRTAQKYGDRDVGAYSFGKEGTDWYDRANLIGSGRYGQSDPYAVGEQKKLVGQLQEAAAGRGPSAAQAQLQAGTDASIKAAQAMAGAARGSGLGAAQLNAINAGTQSVQNAANQSAFLRAQEQQAATAQLGNVLGGMSSNAINDAARQNQLEEFYMSLGQNREQAALLARMQLEKDKQGAWESYENRKMGIAGQNANMDAKYLGAAGQAFSSLGAMGGSMTGSVLNTPGGQKAFGLDGKA